MPVQPAGEHVPVPADRIPGPVELVVADRVAEGVGRVRPAGHVGHVADGPGREHDRAGPVVQLGHDLLHRHHGAPGGQHGLLLHAGDAPVLDVAGPVGPLGMDDRDVGGQRRHGGQRLAGERAVDGGNAGRVAFQPGAAVTAQHRERQARRPGHVPVGHPGVAVLLQLQRARPGVLDCVAEPVQRADAGVAAPGEHQPGGAARADQLVVDHVRGHPDQGQPAAALPDHLVPGCVRDQVGEAFHGEDVAVAHGGLDGRRQRHDLGHRHPPSASPPVLPHDIGPAPGAVSGPGPHPAGPVRPGRRRTRGSRRAPPRTPRPGAGPR